MAITIRRYRKRKRFDVEFANRVLFGFTIAALLIFILACKLCLHKDLYGFIGFIAWTLGWLIAGLKPVREWSLLQDPVLLLVTAPIFVVVLHLFIWNFISPWCCRVQAPGADVAITPSPAATTAAITDTPTFTPSASPSATSTATPAPESPPTTDPAEAYTIAIVDAMLVPRSLFGDQSPRYEAWNEYVEIYNYGESDVDLEGLWLTDGGGVGQPDRLVNWDSRFARYRFPSAANTADTILRPGERGLILSGQYIFGDRPHDELMRENMSSASLILTIAAIENEDFDLLGDWDGLECRTAGEEDFIVIYHGTQDEVDFIVAAYGFPQNFEPGMAPGEMVAGLSGSFPVRCSTWGGVRVVDPSAAGDLLYGKWEFYTWQDRSPGY
jgi:hypothetical protein